MYRRAHSITREGTATGALGAALVAMWYLIVDLAAGRPLHTPDALGRIIFRGDIPSPPRSVVPEIVAGFTVLHLLFFAVVGMGLTFLVHLASRNPAWRMGVWLGLVISFGLFAGVTLMLTTATGEHLPTWSVAGGTLLGVAGMAAYLWRRHPSLEQSFRKAPLGGEEPGPPHPPEGPAIG